MTMTSEYAPIKAEMEKDQQEAVTNSEIDEFYAQTKQKLNEDIRVEIEKKIEAENKIKEAAIKAELEKKQKEAAVKAEVEQYDDQTYASLPQTIVGSIKISFRRTGNLLYSLED